MATKSTPECAETLSESFDPNSSHTPGPWETGAGNCHTVYAVKSNGYRRVIAHCACQDGKHDYDSHESWMNARLIARVPELLTIVRAYAKIPVYATGICHYGLCAPENCSRCAPILQAQALVAEIDREGN